MKPRKDKRYADFQIIGDWIAPGSRVLDLGCGRGLLLEYLKRKKRVFGVGVDVNPMKVKGCVRRGITVFQGDANQVMEVFPDNFFDHVLLSRTIEELETPRKTLEEGMRVGKSLTVGFINYGYWKNRLSFLVKGRQIRNEVYPGKWYERRPANSFSLHEFLGFCEDMNITINHMRPLLGDWTKLCRLLPEIRAGYVLCEISHNGAKPSKE